MTAIYKDPQRSIDERVEDLLARMTLEEKIGQMMQLPGWDSKAETQVREWHLGSVLSVVGIDTLPLQRAALETRLGIPLLVAIDAIHGHSMQYGATIFPSQLGVSCSWNEKLMEQMARATAAEVSCTGIHWTFSPVFCLPRDLRWGRVNETFGEDPLLIGRFGTAMVRGYQGDDLADPQSIAACAKHFAGYGDTVGGRDASEADHSRRKLRALFLPPFEEAVRAGCATFMTGYETIDGTPCTTSRWLLTDVLREEWGFDGAVVTDWNNVGNLVHTQFVSPDFTDASRRAVHAGNDLMMTTPEFYEAAVAAVTAGQIPEAEIDAAVRHILRLKFRLGLFENPRLFDAEKTATVVGSAAHHAVALDAARESAVLLKNQGVLPLDPARLTHVAIIGPNADNPLEQLGDWSLGAGQGQGRMTQHPRACTVTVRDGLERKLQAAGVKVSYAEGCGVTEPQTHKIARAARLAQEADVAVLVLGDQLPFAGEIKSTATLDLQGGQQALFDAVLATGTPVVVVFMASKPLAIPQIVKGADALLCVFNPGMEGGTAIAEILLGEYNPCGKLTISFPYHVGQQPVYYNQLPGVHGQRHPDLPEAGNFEPLFPFGFGLSYTTYHYGTLRLASDVIQPGESVKARITVINYGERPGTETVQCYLRDLVTSATWPLKSLKDYARVTLQSGEETAVAFEIPYEALAIVDADGQRVVEPGTFELMVGPSSRDADLRRATFTVVAPA